MGCVRSDGSVKQSQLRRTAWAIKSSSSCRPGSAARGHSEEHTANCSCWLTPQMSIVDCLKHFNCSLSPLNSGCEVTVICTQHQRKLNMQVTCFYFQTIISNLANKEWVLLHQQIPRLSCLRACKPNHLSWLCSHWQGKKMAIKLLYKVIAWLLAMLKLRLCQQ